MPWEKPSNQATAGATKESGPEVSAAPRTEPSDANLNVAAAGHRRNQSESGGIMERGRPRKRSEASCAGHHKRSGSKQSNSTDKRAFEQLPKGWKASDAVNILSPHEVTVLQKQALQQAARFEVLRKDDVDSLSRVCIFGATCFASLRRTLLTGLPGTPPARRAH